MKSVLPLYRMTGMGRRRRKRGGMRRRRRTRRGGYKMRMIQGSGRRRRRMRGGFFGSILKGIHGIARSVPIVSTALGMTGNPVASGIAKTLGYGRRRKRYGGRMSVFGGRRRKRRMFSVYGGRKRRYRRKRRHGGRRRRYRRRHRLGGRKRRHTRRGRGIMDWLKKGHDFVKTHGLVSKGLSHLGQDKYAGIASSLGYGRRRRMRGGFIKSMGIIPLAMGRGRRRYRRKRRGGRKHKRTYPTGLLFARRIRRR